MRRGLAIQGGGSRGVYAAGVLDAFLEKDITFDQIYGTSCGALTGLNFVSGDKGRSGRLISKMMSDKRFNSLKNLLSKGSVFDFHYLFFVLPQSGDYFNKERFFSSVTEFYPVMTNCLTGEPYYIDKHDQEFWQGVAASASLPVISKPVSVHNIPCLDGGLVMPVPFYPLLGKVEKIVVIATRERGYRKPKEKKPQIKLMHNLYSDFPSLLSSYDQSVELYNKMMDEMDKLNDEGQIFVIYPRKSPKVKSTEKSSMKIMELYMDGLEDGRSTIDAVKEYLEN